MKKINKKKVIILILLVLLIIIEIVAFSRSGANKVIEIAVEIADEEENIENQNIGLVATNEQNEYYITLPEYINEYKITQYNISRIKENEVIEEEVNNNTVEDNEILNTAENLEQSENVPQENVETVKEDIELTPGDKLYLTEKEIEDGNILINAKYDKKENGDLVLYNKEISINAEERTIKVSGYMPKEATLSVEKVEETEIQEQIDQYLINNVNLEVAYDIKILYEDKEYQPNNYNENVKVTITKINTDNDENNYRVVHIGEEKTTEVKEVEKEGENISFQTEEFSVYAVLEESPEAELVAYSTEPVASARASVWEGEVASGYKFGDGTENSPFLISTGDELAYLAQQVNAGNDYANIYFQLACDIDLNNINWTPIGDTDNPFMGIFDGAGHIISNAQINIDSMPTNQIESYGLFGSLGGGNSKTIIKNLEIDNINVSIGGSGNTSSSTWYDMGIHVGTLAGTIYRNTQIVNNIAKNCNISDNGNVTIYNSSFQYAVGGLVGYAQNTSNNTNDPGTNSRYSIENCFVNTNINLSNEVRTSWFMTNTYDAQYHTGGIIGTIRSQQVWPEDCLYVGTIDSNGFIGPIFAALIDSTDYDNRNNYATIWNGNDAGNLTMTSSYNSFAANGTTFNASVTSGNSTRRLNSSYRNIGYVQGVNKGIYVSNISTLLTDFNNNAGNEYLRWKYENNTFSLIPRFTTSINDTNKPTYVVEIENEYSSGPYTYEWYLEDNIVEELRNQNQVVQEKSWDTEYNYTVLVGDGQYYSILHFTVTRYTLYIEFDINEQNDSVTARLEGEALPFINLDDYTYQWYTLDIAGLAEEEIEGATALTLNNLEEGVEYKLIATNNANLALTVEGSFIYGDRNVIYLDYNDGNDRNNGYSPQTAVRTMSTAYGKLDSNAGRNKNIIVLMGTYSNTNFYNYEDDSRNAATYEKDVTITGIYGGVNYNGRLYLYSEQSWNTYEYKYLNGNTTFQYLDLYGANGQLYLYLQGYSLTMGEGITMVNYENSNRNQGLLGSRAPAFHIICGWLQYNYTTLPRDNPEIVIKSGTYGRIIGGGSPGTSDGQGQTTSHDFMGSSMNDAFNISITIDIQNSTTSSDYDYDVNLLTGGSACGNNYSRVTENIKNGSVGRVLGGSIGDSQNIPTGNRWDPWDYPNNTFLGETTINVTGGSIEELYGGCLGRNMGVVDNYGNVDNSYTGNTCDSYFYGTININITGGEITNNIYGAGAGGVTGYSSTSSDPYKNYGENFDTYVNINISGGTIDGDVYGGGYGYTEYLNANVTATDGGSLYGDSNIIISGSPTINGNIYAAGCGYDMSRKPEIAQMEGNSNIEISGTPDINGNIFGAGAGLSNYEEMAKLIGTSNITISSNLDTEIYGGGNNAKTEGTTNINIQNGTHTGDIYGGGNLGAVIGNTTVNVNGGIQNRVFGGGNQAVVTNSTVNINGGTNNEIYAGGNLAEVSNTNVYVKGGETTTLYGGSNQNGTVQNSVIEATTGTVNTVYGGNNIGGLTENATVTINGCSITNAVYGGGNRVDTINATVYLVSSGNSIPYIFGGGNMAAVTTPNVYIQGGQAQNVFGGSNQEGEITESNVEVTGGNLGNIYGGNNQGGTTITTNININGGNIENVYGGGDKANSQTSNIELNKSDNIISNVYGGGNEAGVTTTNVNLNGAQVDKIFGGSNMSGTVTNSYVTTNSGYAENVYGGNNQGGRTETTNVHIIAGDIINVYGGGEQAESNLTNVLINGTVSGDVYGGGNRAGVNTNTNINIENASIVQNVYGGGNEGTVTGNTYVHVKNSKLDSSLYSGGNGSTAIVYGNTNLTIDGTETNIGKNVFGGGNKAATGTETEHSSTSTVNIVSGTIGGNVYGGANTSVVYGVTKTNIGYDTINDNSLEIGNLHICGTVFGGGEANESGSEIYDFSFISVTDGINIEINGNGYEEFDIDGSIFGSGNASSTSGDSYINIQNYGTPDAPKSNVSLQRADCATISNSAIALSGATDRTNEYSDEYYTISRVDVVKLKNNSTLYLNYGANLLTVLESLVDENGQEVKGVVTIDEEANTVTKNVDNRIYMAEGKNLNIATNEQVTAYGQVHGMIFLGLFTNRMNPSTSTGLYNHNYENGDVITNAGTFSSNSYAMAQHMDNHDTSIDGFYTNYNVDGNIKMEYIDTTPADDVYYIWMVGEQMDVTVFELSLTASKYATLGTYELSLMGFSDPNITFSLIGFSAGLDEDISLIDPNDIEAIAENEEDANNIYGLSMEAGKNGWQNQAETIFLTELGGTYTGDSTYKADNSTFTPTLNFCLYHSANISVEKLLGDVKIRLQALVPVDDLNYAIKYIDINITMSTALYQDDYYEAAITPGEEYGLFTSTTTSITKESAFSTYYSLYIEDFSNSEYYNDFSTDYRVLISRDVNGREYSFPKDTRIVMLDLITDKEYYYVVTQEDVNSNKFEYKLSDFIAMGSTDEYFNEQDTIQNYYNNNQDILYENFIFHIKFSEAKIEGNIENNNLLMELRNDENETLLGVLGIQRDIMHYSVYSNANSTINVSATIDDTVYLGDDINFEVTTDFKQQIIDSKTIYDTEYFEKKMGIMLTIYDNDGNQLALDSLFGINFELDGQRYYPRIDGTTRIKIADKVSNVLSKIKVDTSNNSILATGTYTIKVETFGSPDGIYYGLESSASTEVKVTIINSEYGLNLYTTDNYKVVDKETGNTTNGDASIIAQLEYSSGLESPNITMSLYRRDYSEVYSDKYEIVDLADYVTNTLTESNKEKEYILTESPEANSTNSLTLKENLISGTYKLVYKLYDGDNYIGEDYEYIIIK